MHFERAIQASGEPRVDRIAHAGANSEQIVIFFFSNRTNQSVIAPKSIVDELEELHRIFPRLFARRVLEDREGRGQQLEIDNRAAIVVELPFIIAAHRVKAPQADLFAWQEILRGNLSVDQSREIKRVRQLLEIP